MAGFAHHRSRRAYKAATFSRRRFAGHDKHIGARSDCCEEAFIVIVHALLVIVSPANGALLLNTIARIVVVVVRGRRVHCALGIASQSSYWMGMADFEVWFHRSLTFATGVQRRHVCSAGGRRGWPLSNKIRSRHAHAASKNSDGISERQKPFAELRTNRTNL